MQEQYIHSNGRYVNRYTYTYLAEIAAEVVQHLWVQLKVILVPCDLLNDSSLSSGVMVRQKWKYRANFIAHFSAIRRDCFPKFRILLVYYLFTLLLLGIFIIFLCRVK